MKIKKWMMTVAMGILALFTFSSGAVDTSGAEEIAPQKHDVRADAAAAEKIAAWRESMNALSIAQQGVEPVVWTSAPNEGREAPVNLAAELAREIPLPQPISKISGVLIHTDKQTIDQIMRSKEYRGSG